MVNKKAQEMTIGTLVVIILAIIVLVVVVYGFTVGWGNLFGQLTNVGGGKVNVQSIVQSCQIACSTQSTFDYCSRVRNVVFDDKTTASLTCNQLSNPGLSVLQKDGNQFVVTNVGLELCTSVNCVTP